MSAQLLTPEFLRELEMLKRRLDIQARSGELGERAAPRRGGSAEFREHRPYAPGDDPRRIDWMAFARTGQPVTKLFRAEEDAVVRLVLDASLSQAFGNPTKHEATQRVAAAIGALALASGQRAEIALARERPDRADPLERLGRRKRGRAGTAELLREIARVTPEGRADLGRAVRRVVESSARPGFLVLLSDFLDPGPVTASLGMARAAGHDVALVQMMDRSELEPDLEGDYSLVDAETEASVEVTMDPAAIEAYLLRVAGLAEELRAWARRHGATYVRATTDEPLLDVLRRFVKRSVD
jgi:uncharacterized protein (DUF58 family)